MTKKQQTTITLLSIVIMALLLLLSRRLALRFDLTASKAYTLSPVSRNLGNEIEETLRITYYRSAKLLSLYPEPLEIADFLREYEKRSAGKIQVTVKDPGQGEDAERFGLVPQQLQNVEQDQASFSIIYSGLVIEYLDRYETLPFVFSLDTLEYDVTSRIRTLISGKRRELGIMTPENQKDWNEYYGPFRDALTQSGFIPLPLRSGAEIPDTLPALVVLGGVEELDETDLYRIDRYIQLGGSVLFAVEGVEVNLSGSWDARLKTDRGLLAMLSSYGVTVGPSLVMDAAALPLPYRDPYTQRQQSIAYPFWVGVLETQGNPDHPITARFAGVDLYWASPLTLSPPGTVKGEILFTSTNEAWLMTRDFAVNPQPGLSFGGDETEKSQRILAAALEGRFPSWFAGKEIPQLPEAGQWTEDNVWQEEESGSPEGLPEGLPAMPLETKPARIIVIGDADMGSFLVQVTQRYQSLNLNFLLQTADWLGKDDDIVGIRNRSGGSGRLDRISDEGRRFGMMSFSRILNIFLVPILIIIYGAARLLKRKYKKEQDHAL
ncbi:hypothetical protein AGMMS50230_19310 [Spirochaetia bacterium]|nr:hypothetical protein AGMMS50230_19310 [Spirochaetia bacterium]